MWNDQEWASHFGADYLIGEERMKLTDKQKELIISMQKGVKIDCMPYIYGGSVLTHFFRDDTHQRCTAAAKALNKHGLIKNNKNKYYEKDNYELTDLGRNWKP